MKSTLYSEENIFRISQGWHWATRDLVLPAVRSFRIHCPPWRSKYKLRDGASLKRFRQLEAENTRLKKIVSQSVPDIDASKELASKEWCAPSQTGGQRVSNYRKMVLPASCLQPTSC